MPAKRIRILPLADRDVGFLPAYAVRKPGESPVQAVGRAVAAQLRRAQFGPMILAATTPIGDTTGYAAGDFDARGFAWTFQFGRAAPGAVTLEHEIDIAILNADMT